MSSVLQARFVLIAVALAIALPSRFAIYWGGETTGSAGFVLLMGVTWAALLVAVHRWWRGGHLWLDVVALTALLSASGAAQNPFTMLYFVPMTLASIVAKRSTWRVALLSVMGFSLLLAQTTWSLWPHRSHPHHAHFFHHVFGMAVALAVVGVFVSFFVHRVGKSLAEKEIALQDMERERREDRFAVSLGALAAGAAHELGTPLGTIQLLAADFAELPPSEQRDACQQILSQVARMKTVLHGLASSELSAEVLRDRGSWGFEALEAQLVDVLSDVDVRRQRAGLSSQPLGIVVQIVRELLQNAKQVAPGVVRLELDLGPEELSIRVCDRGPGLSPEDLQRVTSPFYSRRGGTGLGLFLASVHARQLGGHLRLSSELGQGTVAALTLPTDLEVGGDALGLEKEGRLSTS